MTAEEIAQLAALCRVRAGLRVNPEKTYLIESRLAPVARREGFDTIADLLASIQARRDEALIWAAVEAMAAGETSFFRDRAPFAEFAQEIVPELARTHGGQPIRVWSAACGTGQEIYSLALAVRDLAQRDPALRIEFAASDLSRLALERAQSGLYNQFEVQRGLPVRLLAGHFDKEGEQWRLSSALRQKVRWRRINLIAGLRQIGRFDVVFCRYVLGHMTAESQKAVVADLAAVIPPDGYLVLGLKEEVPAVEQAFQPVVGRAGLYRPSVSSRAAAA